MALVPLKTAIYSSLFPLSLLWLRVLPSTWLRSRTLGRLVVGWSLVPLKTRRAEENDAQRVLEMISENSKPRQKAEKGSERNKNYAFGAKMYDQLIEEVRDANQTLSQLIVAGLKFPGYRVMQTPIL
ncbi:hypothetical protein TNCV_3660951 [Trichonephila clavipes]|nr:hypothetical protein TNCV_3660951 [Trichonephila clavipes]